MFTFEKCYYIQAGIISFIRLIGRLWRVLATRPVLRNCLTTRTLLSRASLTVRFTVKNGDPPLKILTSSHGSLAYVLLLLAIFWCHLVYFFSEKSILPYFSSPRGVATSVPFPEVRSRKGTESGLTLLGKSITRPSSEKYHKRHWYSQNIQLMDTDNNVFGFLSFFLIKKCKSATWQAVISIFCEI